MGLRDSGAAVQPDVFGDSRAAVQPDVRGDSRAAVRHRVTFLISLLWFCACGGRRTRRNKFPARCPAAACHLL